MKRIFFSMVMALCLMMLAVPAMASSDAGWYIDEETKTLYINGKGSTQDINPAGWGANFKIEHVVVGEGITEIAENAFCSCLYLKSVQLPSTVTQIGKRAFMNTALTEFAVPEGVTVISEETFYQCTSLTKVEMHNGITHIGSDAFNSCTALKAVDIPGSVTGFGSNMFTKCTALEEVRFLNGVTRLPNHDFYQCSALRYLEIPDTVESLRYVHFTHLESLEVVRLGSGLTTLYEPTFRGCNNLKRFEISPDNATFCSVDGVIYSKDQTALVKVPLGYEGAYEVLPGTLRIGENAANGCTKLTAVTVPSGVTFIDDYAFRDCEGLETAILNEGLVELDQGVFFHCEKLKNLELNEGLVTIGASVFNGCTSLESVVIPSTVTMIQDYGFEGCTGLKRIEFLGNLPTIRGAFRGVEADAYHPEGNVTWENGRLDYDGKLDWPQDPAFDRYSGDCEGTDAVWHLNPDSGVLTISGQGPMGHLSDMRRDVSVLVKSLVIKEGITEIPHSAFVQMKNLTEAKIAASVRKIEGEVFKDCDALKRVDILSSDLVMGMDIFYDCNALQSVRFAGDAPEFDSRTFFGVSTVVYYPAGKLSWIQPQRADLSGEITWIEYGQEENEVSDAGEGAGLELLLWIIPAVIVVAGVVTVIVILEKKRV